VKARGVWFFSWMGGSGHLEGEVEKRELGPLDKDQAALTGTGEESHRHQGKFCHRGVA